jgi:hypothetical protein
MVTTRSQSKAAQMSPDQQKEATRSQPKRKHSEIVPDDQKAYRLQTFYHIDSLKCQGKLVTASNYIAYLLELREQNIPEGRMWYRHVQYYLNEVSAREKGEARIDACIELYKYLSFMLSDPTIIGSRPYSNPSNLRFDEATLKKGEQLLKRIDELLKDGDISTASYNELKMNILTVKNIIRLQWC